MVLLLVLLVTSRKHNMNGVGLTYCHHMTAQPVGPVAYKQNRRKRQAYVFLNTTVKGHARES